ncbi:hypothetical protein U0070_008369 [Myodes glareolus]|uniref:Uncharacterized protein n=1 Tax=Myodes glareolus TaxID=447135 RepID=A0AAW0IY89_MYOGA
MRRPLNRPSTSPGIRGQSKRVALGILGCPPNAMVLGVLNCAFVCEDQGLVGPELKMFPEQQKEASVGEQKETSDSFIFKRSAFEYILRTTLPATTKLEVTRKTINANLSSHLLTDKKQYIHDGKARQSLLSHVITVHSSGESQ